ncbi:hypothetical protein CTAYLR_007257 [Chrysophaeum taylorii]|uniref:Pre-mRNA-splicing factor SPF27 n=1 Tax=Chrysophaeum taylorii TaxID=2483200 RepID=A0AAD7UDN4_9STRA|nr:hypothetical protein CTAYLR_007257 [Chrysophaeum taylorii]
MTTMIVPKTTKDDDDDDVWSASLREKAALMDAMAYVEPPATGGVVNKLIEAEMGSAAAPALPPSRPPQFGPMVLAELERIDRGEAPAPLSIERYNCDPPRDRSTEWPRALHNCWAQLEHQANRVVNLELAEAFAEATWKRHVQDLENLHRQLEALASATERRAETINLKRKADQEAIAPEILRCDRDYDRLVRKHLDLERAIARLRGRDRT